MLDLVVHLQIFAATLSYLVLLIQYHLPRAQEKIVIATNAKLTSF